MNVASYYDYVLINSYLAFCFLLFDRTTLLQLVVNSLFSYGWPKKQQEVLPLPPGCDASPSQGFPSILLGLYLITQLEVLQSIPDGMPITGCIMSPTPIYTPGPGWRETMWSKVSCLKKQYDSCDQALNHRP